MPPPPTKIASQVPGRDAARTRQALLEAAQEIFSIHGYNDAGVRQITARAGVNMALVSRYFGSKERLFEEALRDILGTGQIVDAHRADFGRAMVELLLDPAATRIVALPIIMMASGDPKARAIVERLLMEMVYEPLSRWFGPEEGAVRAARFMIVSAGMTLYSRLYPLDVLVPDADPSLRAWLVDQFQALAD
jgi:AcrR family transcriptional regulator